MAKSMSGYYVGRSWRDKRDFVAQFRRDPNQLPPPPANVVAYWAQFANQPRRYPADLLILDGSTPVARRRVDNADQLASLIGWYWEHSRHMTLSSRFVPRAPERHRVGRLLRTRTTYEAKPTPNGSRLPLNQCNHPHQQSSPQNQYPYHY